MKNLVKIILINFFALFLISCITPLNRVKTLYSKGENSEKAGKIKLALSYYKTALDYTDKISNDYPFLKKYYKSIIYFKLGNKEKGLKFIELLNNPPSAYEDEYLFLKSVYFNENGFYKLSLNISELLLNSKNYEMKTESFKLYSDTLIELYKRKSISEKEYKSKIKKLYKIMCKRYTNPLCHYYIFNLLMNIKSYEKALEEGFLSLDFGLSGEEKKDLIYSLRFMKSAIDNKLLKKYELFFRRYNVTDN